MNTGFSLFCDEQKKQSVSPRRVFKAKRRGTNNNEHNTSFNIHASQNVFINDQDTKFTKMTDQQYLQYQEHTMSNRMNRKRNFDIFSSGSNLSLYETLQSAQTFRIPHYALFYVRVDPEPTANASNPNAKHNPIAKAHSNDAFQLMMNSTTDSNFPPPESKTCEETPDDDTEMMENDGHHIIYPTNRECLITRCVRVSSEWVAAYDAFSTANNKIWRQSHPNAKIHEYQINRLHGITLLNLDKSNKTLESATFKNNEQNIKQWVLDHGYSGFIADSCFHFFQPHLYWNLLDDNKELKVKQALISDMFQSTKSKPKHAAWKATFD